MKPRDFISVAKYLVKSASGRPPQIYLRRATSTAYYALFHALAKTGADPLVGGPNSVRSKHAWRQVYRALEHGFAKNACKKGEIISQFPKPIEDFANMFVTMQIKRHNADYDPTVKFRKSEVKQDTANTEQVLDRFYSCSSKDRCAFAAYVLFRTRN